MIQTVTQVIKWVSIPVVLFASMFSYLAARYEPLLVEGVILGAIILVERAVRLKEYSWAVGLVAIVVVFSPAPLVSKMFLLMGLICVGTFTTLLAVFRTQPVPVPAT